MVFNHTRESIAECFDSVLFLTSSDWFTEPRSNRYHFASRFAKHLPVTFIQFDLATVDPYVEETEIHNIKVLHVNSNAAPSGIVSFVDKTVIENTIAAIRANIGHRPLVWVYNPYSTSLLRSLNPTFAVYHATEIYLPMEDNMYSDDSAFLCYLNSCVKDLIQTVDLIFAVSDGVVESIANTGLAGEKLIENYNGVDIDFWLGDENLLSVPYPEGRPVVLYQGGVNDRLDFALIHEVCSALKDWDFWFVGAEDTESPIWEKTRELKNVTAFGAKSLEDIRSSARRATVGWAPFRQIYQLYTSMPLKIYEYLACGLPVVSSPIRALEGEDEQLFRFAQTPTEFVEEIVSVQSTRTDDKALKLREKIARDNSYDSKFSFACEKITDTFVRRDSKKTVLIVYDDKFSKLPAIDWHLRSFERYSRHQIIYLPGSIVDGMTGKDHMFAFDTAEDLCNAIGTPWDFSIFDVIVIHFSLRTTIEGYIPQFLVDQIAAFRGPKILFIQDEYDHVEMTWDYILKMGISDIFTCVPEEGLEYVYPKERLPGLRFHSTLTGYIPEDISFSQQALPISDRKFVLGYRGRQLPHHYGMLGYEKMIIGQRMKEEAESRGLLIDIETDDNKRIYQGWYQFLGSCRATLGTESGCNIFDFDGKLNELANVLAHLTFDKAYSAHFAQYEAPFRMNQISPKFFEAIILKTALVCFPGEYSGILERDVHYIALEKDFSNIDEVFKKLADDSFLENMTKRAYDDVVGSGRYTLQSFIADFDKYLDKILPKGGTELILSPIAIRRGDRISAVQHRDNRDYVVTSSPLGGQVQRESFRKMFEVAPMEQIIIDQSPNIVVSGKKKWFLKYAPDWLHPFARRTYHILVYFARKLGLIG